MKLGLVNCIILLTILTNQKIVKANDHASSSSSSYIAAAAYAPQYFQRQRRIIGGQNAPANEYPWAVTIRGNFPGKEKSVNVCGATTIAKRWLVTAAHCFWSKDEELEMDLRNPKLWHMIAGQVFVAIESYIDNYDPNNGGRDTSKYPNGNGRGRGDKTHNHISTYKELKELLKNRFKNKIRSFENKINRYLNNLLRQAALSFTDDRNKRAVEPIKEKISTKDLANHFHFEKIILHPRYTPDDIEYDIALIKLDRDLPLNLLPGINAISLPTTANAAQQPKPKDVCVIVGWGCMKTNGEPSATAQFTKLRVFDHHSCNSVYKSQAGLNKHHEFCAGYVNRGIGICPGDSGGGLACKNEKDAWYIAGATSATHAERPGHYPGLFTRVSYFVDWIRKTMAL